MLTKYIKRFAVKMNDENIQDILSYGAARNIIMSDFEVTMELNAEDGIETYFVAEKHSDERSPRFYQIDSQEFDAKFVFYNGNTRAISTSVMFQEIKPV